MNRTINIYFVIVLVSCLTFQFLDYKVNLNNLCQYNASPVIYGEDMCTDIFHGKVYITSNMFEKFINLFSQKTVLSAKFDDNDILIKSLVPSDHFHTVEDNFENNFKNITFTNQYIDIVKLKISSSLKINPGSAIISKIRLCPDSSNIENLFNKINISEVQFQDYLHLWTIVETNPEPLILKMLQPPKWPVPKFFGSCGRIIAVEDCGTILTEFYSHPWHIRAKLSYQLLEAVLKFTFDDPDFAFYFTDISPDNIAVDDNGILKFIDLENVVLVDKNPIMEENMGDWKQYHSSRHINCWNCFIFESDEICIHQISDHNIYAVCKEIFFDSSLFPGGFLYGPPIFDGELQKLKGLIPQCVEGGPEYDRFEIAYRIMALLKYDY